MSSRICGGVPRGTLRRGSSRDSNGEIFSEKESYSGVLYFVRFHVKHSVTTALCIAPRRRNGRLIVPRGTRGPCHSQQRFVSRGTPTNAPNPRRVVPRGTILIEFHRSKGVPRETSCIPDAILLTFRELGACWHESLRLQIKKEEWARQPPQ